VIEMLGVAKSVKVVRGLGIAIALLGGLVFLLSIVCV
jgi:hypothetical protein